MIGTIDKALAQSISKIAQEKSKQMFEEVFDKLFSLTLPQKTKEYFLDKYESKEKWALAYKKQLPCLQIGTTSRIEGLNSLIKEAILSSIGICELIYRMLKLHTQILSKPFSGNKVVSMQLIQDLESISLFSQLKSYISKWAYEKCALSLSQSWGFEIKNLKKTIILKSTENGYSFELWKSHNNKPLECKCSFFVTMGLPCNHLFAIGKQFPKLVDLKGVIRRRWLQQDSFPKFEDSTIINVIKEEFLEKSKKPIDK